MAERVDLRLESGAPDERIIARNRAIVTEPQHFARVAVCVLRAVAADGHEQRAIRSERDTRRTGAGRGDEDVARIGEPLAVPASSGKRDGRSVALERLGVGEIHEAIFCKAGMERDVHEAVDCTGFTGPAAVA